ncbi:MAG: phage portal protein, partial [Sneathiella sp.]
MWRAIGGRAGHRTDGIQATGGGSVGDNVSPDMALKLSAVWACVRLRAEAIGSMPINIYEKKQDGTRIKVTDHRLLRVLNESPNHNQTRNEFFETLSINQDLTGNFYGEVTRNNSKEIVSIVPLMSQQMNVRLKGKIKTFDYTENN